MDGKCYNSQTYDTMTLCTRRNQYLNFGESCADPTGVYSDPLYQAQSWVYDMIQVEDVWETYTGAGVRVRVNDNGMNRRHAEFRGRFDVEASCQVIEVPELELQNPAVVTDHGTIVAGIIGAAKNNNQCSVGIAPDVTLSFCYALSADPSAKPDDLLVHKLDQMDISSNSWGRAACRKGNSRRLQEDETPSCPFLFEGEGRPNPCNATTCLLTDFGPTATTTPSDACRTDIANHCACLLYTSPSPRD